MVWVRIKIDGCAEKKYSPITPVMAAGITDHIWTFKELLTFRKGWLHNQSNGGRAS